MTTIDLDQVNRARRHKGLPPLSRDQAYSAMRERSSSATSSDSGFDTTHFLIGYMTGIPMPSAGGIMGAMMHPHSDPAPSYSAPDPTPAPSSDYSSSSSSSYGSGSSSSYDSGSSSSFTPDTGSGF